MLPKNHQVKNIEKYGKAKKRWSVSQNSFSEMMVLSSNLRGMGGPKKLLALKKIMGKEKPSIVLLQETKLET